MPLGWTCSQYVKEGLQPLSHRNQVAFRHGSLLTRDDLRLVHSDVHLCNLEVGGGSRACRGALFFLFASRRVPHHLESCVRFNKYVCILYKLPYDNECTRMYVYL